MSGVNKAIIMGRLGKDPELKTLPSGDAFTKLSVATSKKWKDKQNQEKEQTEWHNIVVWRKAAETICKFLKKGSMIYVEGELQTRSWDDNGVKKYATEIVCSTFQFCGSSGEGSRRQDAPTPDAPPEFLSSFSDDVIPF